jgi:hypothetical protein
MTTYSEQLKAAALRAGIVDLDALVLADLSRDDGTAKAADELVAEFKQSKPHMFKPKMARDMSLAERETFLREHKRKFNL